MTVQKPTSTKGRSCDGKMRHRSLASAHRHLTRLRRGGAAEGAYAAYACRSCGLWHVGHQPGRKRRAA